VTPNDKQNKKISLTLTILNKIYLFSYLIKCGVAGRLE
jgi:hypothetical protein